MSYQPTPIADKPRSGGLEYKWKVLIAVVSGLFMVILDATVINVALKTLQSEFHASTNEVQWVISIYTLALGIATPLSAFLADRFTTKRIYRIGLAMFVVGSLLCGISTILPTLAMPTGNLLLLVIFRAVQGVGGGIALPLGTAMLFGSFERKEQGLAFGIFGIVLVFAPAIGPLLGGWLVDHNLWQWIFFVNIPIGVIGVVLASLWLRQDQGNKEVRIDIPGIIFSTLGFGSILYAASIAGQQGWGSITVLIGFGVGVISLAAFVFTELRVEHPLLDLRLFQIRNYLVASFVGWVGVVALFGAEFLLPLYLQILRGKSAFDAGLLLLPLAIAAGFSTPIAGRIADKLGPRSLATLGFALLTFNTWQLSQLELNTDFGYIALLMAMRGVALGMVIQSAQVAALRDVPLPKLSRASALLNSTQQTIQAIAIAALATVLTNSITIQIPAQFQNAASGGNFNPDTLPPLAKQAFQQFQNQYIDGLHNAYTVTLVISVVATLLAMLLPGWPGKYEHAATPVPPAEAEQPLEPAVAV